MILQVLTLLGDGMLGKLFPRFDRELADFCDWLQCVRGAAASVTEHSP
jgi:hypothetical protein